MWLEILHADSWWGIGLSAAGALSLLTAAIVHGVFRWPTILTQRQAAETKPPTLAERISVHLLIYGAWALVFGAVIWRGVAAGARDVRFAFERDWPVWEQAEWIYLSVYFVPAAMPWLAPTRAALRRYSVNLWRLLAVSVPLFLLPLASPARSFNATTFAGELLQWETMRGDFAAASLPSFHVFWGLLVGQLLATRGRGWAWVGWSWAAAVALACIATGTHALADVAASGAMFWLMATTRSPVAAALQAVADRLFSKRAPMNPSRIPTTTPPMP